MFGTFISFRIRQKHSSLTSLHRYPPTLIVSICPDVFVLSLSFPFLASFDSFIISLRFHSLERIEDSAQTRSLLFLYRIPKPFSSQNRCLEPTKRVFVFVFRKKKTRFGINRRGERRAGALKRSSPKKIEDRPSGEPRVLGRFRVDFAGNELDRRVFVFSQTRSASLHSNVRINRSQSGIKRLRSDHASFFFSGGVVS